jgi:acyl-coenzyme A synthetase/AMP-(fatty) acid ligase
MVSHRNAISFVGWAADVFQARPEDRFSSHAPFHFDLSILDIYVPLSCGASVALIDEQLGKDPVRLGEFIEQWQLTVWYSTPSVLTLLAQYGRLAERDLSSLRTILFAGEVFPIKHLRALKALVPAPDYFNLYGPTETNVCTFLRLPDEIPAERGHPFSIGLTCEHFRSRVVTPGGDDVAAGEEGELCVAGDGVMMGYWNRPERTEASFLPGQPGPSRWYRTGDLVVEGKSGYTFVGRRDRMVKRRGHRVELGEVEAGLYKHPAVIEAAAVAFEDDNGVRIEAFLVCGPQSRPSIIEFKKFCSEVLPASMGPDRFHFPASLPKTSTDKIDYQRLLAAYDE